MRTANAEDVEKERGMMSPEEAAAVLNSNQRAQEGSKTLFAAMKDAGLVAVYGASDDLMEFRGAIYEELGAVNGCTAYFDERGLLENECQEDDCPYWEKVKGTARTIEAVWGADNGISWTYKTDIPHATFNILEDGEVYCQGIVFRLSDAIRKVPIT